MTKKWPRDAFFRIANTFFRMPFHARREWEKAVCHTQMNITDVSSYFFTIVETLRLGLIRCLLVLF